MLPFVRGKSKVLHLSEGPDKERTTDNAEREKSPEQSEVLNLQPLGNEACALQLCYNCSACALSFKKGKTAELSSVHLIAKIFRTIKLFSSTILQKSPVDTLMWWKSRLFTFCQAIYHFLTIYCFWKFHFFHTFLLSHSLWHTLLLSLSPPAWVVCWANSQLSTHRALKSFMYYARSHTSACNRCKHSHSHTHTHTHFLPLGFLSHFIQNYLFFSHSYSHSLYLSHYRTHPLCSLSLSLSLSLTHCHPLHLSKFSFSFLWLFEPRSVH